MPCGVFAAVVDDAQIEIENDVDVVFQIAPRDRISRVTVRGGDSQMARRFRLLAGAIYEPARIRRMADAAELAYHHAGRGDAIVEVSRAHGNRGIDVCVAANPGPQLVVRGWRFPGRTGLSEDTLLAALPKTDGKLNRPGGHYDPDGLELDRLYLQVAYWDRGYANVELGPTRIVRKGRSLHLEVPITEGPVFHLGKVTTSWWGPLPLGIASGDLFSRTRIVEARDKLRDRLGAADIVPKTTVDLERKTIDLHFDIQWRWPWDAFASLLWRH
jgi:outer membrane protein assembly factor BamA